MKREKWSADVSSACSTTNPVSIPFHPLNPLSHFWRSMSEVRIVERDMTAAELKRMSAGFDEHTVENGVEIQSSKRIGFVALDGENFIGCASGLAYKNGSEYSGWFYLTDLFVEKAYRLQGLGSRLLKALEEKIRHYGINKIWTWTAGYEGPEFYKRQGYKVFAEMENWYSGGHSRIGVRKEIDALESRKVG